MAKPSNQHVRDAVDLVDEPDLPDNIALPQPADLTFDPGEAQIRHCGCTVLGDRFAKK